MKPDDRALKNYVKDVCSNINKGIFEFDYGYAILKEKDFEFISKNTLIKGISHKLYSETFKLYEGKERK